MIEKPHDMAVPEGNRGPLEAIAKHVRLRPQALALLDVEGSAWTFANLDHRRRAWASRVRAVAQGRRSVTAVMLPPGPAAIAAMLAAATAGTAAPCGVEERAEELARAFEAAAVSVLLAASPISEGVAQVVRSRGIAVVTIDPSAATEAAPHDRAAHGDGDEACYVLRTSGTTGASSLVAVSHAVAGVRFANLARALTLTAADRCLVVTPLHHSTGLGTTLAALATGGSACCAPGFDAARLFTWLRDSQATWLAMSPAMLAAVLAARDAGGLDVGGHCLRFVRSGNAPLPAELARAAEDCFGVPVVHAYGTTETGLVTCEPLPPALRKSGSSGVSAGARVAILEAAGGELAVGAEGDIAVTGGSIPPPRLHSAGTIWPDGTRWLRTGDRGFLDHDGYLFVVGRTSEFVNVGGRKVAPDEVEQVLRRHPDVADAAAFGLPDERLGERVAALVVPSATISATALRRWLLPRLSPHKLPGSISFAAAIPRDALGKVRRATLAAAMSREAPGGASSLDAAPARDAASTMPAELGEPESLIAYLATAWREALGVEAVSLDDDFLSLGGDSLLAARVTTRLERELNLRLPLRGLLEAPNLAAFARNVEATAAESTPARAGPTCGRGDSRA